MAAAVVLGAYLRNTLGFRQNAVTALQEQGLNSVDDLLDFTDEDITQICRNCRRPGGVLPDGTPDPGVNVGHAMALKLKMLRFYRKHLERVQRHWVANTATVARLRALWKQKEAEEEEAEDDDMPDKLTNINTVREVLENIQHYFLHHRGTNGIPLAYVIRERVALPVNDPGWGQPSYDGELIARAPHNGVTFDTNNATVWQVIRHVAHEGPGWNWVVPFARTTDGRGAYLALYEHYMGDAFQERIRARADALLARTFYDGRSRQFTFERYCEVINRAIQDLVESGEDVPEPRRIRIFTQGIRETRLQTAVATVLATPNLRGDFTAAVNYISQFVDLHAAHAQATHRVVSATGRGGGGRGGRGFYGGRGRGGRFGRGGGRGGRGHFGGRGRGRGRGGHVENRYYQPEEWAQLSPDERTRVRTLRNEQDRTRTAAAAARAPVAPPVASARSVRAARTEVPTEVTTSREEDTVAGGTVAGSTTIGATMSRRTRRGA